MEKEETFLQKKLLQERYDLESNNYLDTRPWMNYYIRHRIAELFLPWLKSYKKGNLVLHVGCGVGWLEKTLPLTHSDSDYIAVDFSIKMAHKMKTQFPEIEVVVADGEYLPFRSSSLDRVIVDRFFKYCCVNRVFSEVDRVCRNQGSIAVIFDCADSVFQRLLELVNKPYDVTCKSMELIKAINKYNIQKTSCSAATTFPIHRFWNFPQLIYLLIGYFDKAVKQGRISVFFGKKNQNKVVD